MRVRAVLILLLLVGDVVADETVAVAVSSNFITTFEELARRFESETGIKAVPHRGSTGHLYAQIVNGAPYDVFLAADAERPKELAAEGIGVEGSRFTYAIGRLAVYSASQDDCLEALRDPATGWIALANPELAPYGAATREFLEAIDAWDPSRYAMAPNVMTVPLFARYAGARISIYSKAQFVSAKPNRVGCLYDVPSSMHSIIEQQAILLDTDNDNARRFLEYLRSEGARSYIEIAGYEVPE